MKPTLQDLLDVFLQKSAHNKVGYWKVWHDDEIRIESYYYGTPLAALEKHYKDWELQEPILVIKSIKIENLTNETIS